MIKQTNNYAKQKVQELAKLYRVRVYFNKNLKSMGLARYWKRSMTILSNQDSEKIISVFFHELGHIYCFNNSLWTSYHNNKLISEMTDRDKKLVVRTAVRAERWVDKWATKEMAKHFPKMNYYTNYNDAEVIQSFKESIKEELELTD